MQDSIEISPSGPIDAQVRPPGSKSITNRALVCAALAAGTSTLQGALDSDDTRVMFDALGQLGIAAQFDSERATLSVAGCAGRIPAERADLFVGNSGTTVRFLAAMLTIAQGEFHLSGTRRMHERPIGDLLEALRQWGTEAVSDQANGCPPLTIRSHGLRGGEATVRGDTSSQFLSGLLMAAPYAEQQAVLTVAGPLVSQPYVEMTLAVMEAFGVRVAREAAGRFRVPNDRPYAARTYDIEPDASAASYFFAAAAIAGGTITVRGLARDSLQGDVRFVDVLARMGCQVDYAADAITVRGGPLRGVSVDMNDISDTVQTLGAVALFAEGTTEIRGVGHIRHKETDRLAALSAELRKLGALVEQRGDGLAITPGPLRAARIATYDDHRMAMSLALVGLKVPGVTILDPGCTAKTYPRYWEDLAAVSCPNA